MKRKENSFSLQWEEEELSLRINVHKDWLRDHFSRVPCGIGILIRGILKSCFWISLHQGTLSILCSKIQGYMLSIMNEVDLWLLLLLCVLYEIQNQIFQHVHLGIGPPRFFLWNKLFHKVSWVIIYCYLLFRCAWYVWLFVNLRLA